VSLKALPRAGQPRTVFLFLFYRLLLPRHPQLEPGLYITDVADGRYSGSVYGADAEKDNEYDELKGSV